MISVSFNTFSAKFTPGIDRFLESFFRAKVRHSPYEFISNGYEHLGEYCLRTGKRVRPLLLILAHQGYGGSIPAGEIIKLASAIEIMHCFLLIQDDIIDRSDLRRGRKTLHMITGERFSSKTTNSRIGSDVAIVLADVLFANALEIISSARIDSTLKSRFIALFSETYEYTAWGQMLDSIHSMPRSAPDSTAPDMIGTFKTAYYTIYYPLAMGLLLSGNYTSREAAKLKSFALPLGLSFQIRDDLLGVFGDEYETGKSSLTDLAEGKLTHLITDTIDRLTGKDRTLFLEVFGKERKTVRDLYYLKKAISESGCREESHGRIALMTDRSMRALKKLSIADPEKAVLEDFMNGLAGN